MAAAPDLDLTDPDLPADAVIAALGLLPHPEGGHYRETWRGAPVAGPRGSGTAILFLLRARETSHWHRVDADELWIWQAGAPLALAESVDGRTTATHRLGPHPGAGERFHHAIVRGAWQSATSTGAWTLVSCTVSPAFEFAGFELAPPGWRPGA
jgi:predicted cupin superfamily sugar epimerase